MHTIRLATNGSSDILNWFANQLISLIRDRQASDAVPRPSVPTSNIYPNVTTLRSGLCYRNSVCRLSSVCLSSVVCRLSVTLVHPTQVVEPFGKISSPLCTLAIL